MNMFKPLGAAALAIGVFVAAPAEAITTNEIKLREAGAETSITLTCPVLCLGLTGQQDGDDAVLGSGSYNSGVSDIFYLPNASGDTEADFLADLIDLDNELPLEFDLGEELITPPGDADKTDFAGEEGVFEVSPGFFLVKLGDGGGKGGGKPEGRRVAYFYAGAQNLVDGKKEVEFALNGASGYGLSHVSEFGGLRFDPPSLEEPPNVPLPAALPLLGAGLAVLGLIARRRQG